MPFTLHNPGPVRFAGNSGAMMRWSLRDAENHPVAEGEGDSLVIPAGLPAGKYWLYQGFGANLTTMTVVNVTYGWPLSRG